MLYDVLQYFVYLYMSNKYILIGIEKAHKRAQLRAVLKGNLKKGANLEEAIGIIMDSYDDNQIRILIENNSKKDLQKTIDELSGKLSTQRKYKKKKSRNSKVKRKR